MPVLLNHQMEALVIAEYDSPLHCPSLLCASTHSSHMCSPPSSITRTPRPRISFPITLTQSNKRVYNKCTLVVHASLPSFIWLLQILCCAVPTSHRLISIHMGASTYPPFQEYRHGSNLFLDHLDYRHLLGTHSQTSATMHNSW